MAPPSLVFELDHRANAASVGLDLFPTTLLVFGAPPLGTPLMRDRRTIGIDLPQEFLVTEADDGTVTIWWNDPFRQARRHAITGQQRATLATIAGALRNLATVGAGG